MKRLYLLVFIFLSSVTLFAAPIKIVSFNILAPPWAKPSSYPESSEPYLDRELRRVSIIDVLNSLKGSSDVIALQEITPIEFGYIKSALKDFVAIQVNHDPDYWSQYITDNPPWEPNGNALFLKKSTFKNVSFSDVPLSTSGNHGAYAEAKLKANNQQVKIFSVHFDSDHGGNRKKEMEAAVAHIGAASNSIDIIAGDFNSSPQQGNYSNLLELQGYIDVLAAIGNTEITTPYTTQYSSSNNFGIIDHVMVRNAQPIAGDVIDNNLFTIYPDGPAHANEEPRITANLQITGSDHFPVWGSIEP